MQAKVYDMLSIALFLNTYIIIYNRWAAWRAVPFGGEPAYVRDKGGGVGDVMRPGQSVPGASDLSRVHSIRERAAGVSVPNVPFKVEQLGR